MKVESLEISEGLLGLRAARMDRLGDVVLLAGPNGGGKSRVLKLLGSTASGSDPTYPQTRQRVDAIERAIRDGGQHPDLISLPVLRDTLSKFPTVAWISDGSAIPRVENIELTGNWTVSAPNTSFGTPSSLAPDGNTLQLKSDLINRGVQKIHDLLHQRTLAHSPVVDDAVLRLRLDGDFERLNKLAKDLLGTQFDFHPQQGSRIFGRPVHESELSRGQMILLGILASLFLYRDLDASEVVFVWDEPEVHLHPNAVIDVIDRLRRNFPQAQFWIATHSIHLLAHFEEQSIWYVRNGQISRAGRNTHEVLCSLIGDERGLAQLHDFLRLPGKRALHSFASQCLSEPGVADFSSTDPQLRQIRDVLLSHISPGKPLRILDFGAGKCRLLDELSAMAANMGRPVGEVFDYVGYDWSDPADPAIDAKNVPPEALYRAYGKDGARRYVTGTYDVLAKFAEFDVVLLCNSLHEIDVDYWPQLFGEYGLFHGRLNSNGHLFIVEDYLLSIGERAHRHGFLLLDELELKDLLDDRNSIRSWQHENEKFADRLRTHAIPRATLAGYSPATQLRAVKTLERRCWREVERLHGQSLDDRSGREFAFWTHQFVNAHKALLELERTGAASNDEPLSA